MSTAIKKRNGGLTFVNIGELAKNENPILQHPHINTPKDFTKVQQDLEVKYFMRKFEEWNISLETSVLTRVWQRCWEVPLALFKVNPYRGALDAMNYGSMPYIQLQTLLAEHVASRLQPDSEVLDLGCGRFDFIERLHSVDNESTSKIRRLYGLDLDDRVLRDSIEKLLHLDYRQSVALIQSLSNCPCSIWDARLDLVVSSLGATMYAFTWPTGERGINALKKHVQDIHRMLKTGGVLAVSGLKPHPSFLRIMSDSLLEPLLSRPDMTMQTLAYGPAIKRRSQFMQEYAQKGYAHYLSVSQWTDLLNSTDFEVELAIEDHPRAYAHQGIVIIARKK